MLLLLIWATFRTIVVPEEAGQMSVQGLSTKQVPAHEWGTIERFEPGRSNVAVTVLSRVAAMGGFLFGYDSSVINGAVGAIGTHFNLAAGPLGFAVAPAGVAVDVPGDDRPGRDLRHRRAVHP
jgi:hypothetical protein